MAKFLKYCFGRWWRPLLWSITCLIPGLSAISGKQSLENFAFAFILLGLGLLIALISTIYQFFKLRWVTGLISLVVLGATIIAFAFAIWMEQLRDTFADNLKIPSNIPIENPVDFAFDGDRPYNVTNRRVT